MTIGSTSNLINIDLTGVTGALEYKFYFKCEDLDFPGTFAVNYLIFKVDTVYNY